MTAEQITAFFDAYRDAFNRLDGDAVADLWHTPSGITDSHAEGAAGRLTWWGDEAPMRANHRALCGVYREAGFARTAYTLEAFTPMGPNHAFAHLSWTIHRADDSVLQRFQTGYNLLRTASGPRVLLCTAHAENLKEMKPHAAA